MYSLDGPRTLRGPDGGAAPVVCEADKNPIVSSIYRIDIRFRSVTGPDMDGLAPRLVITQTAQVSGVDVQRWFAGKR